MFLINIKLTKGNLAFYYYFNFVCIYILYAFYKIILMKWLYFIIHLSFS